jgi:ribosomal protein S21
MGENKYKKEAAPFKPPSTPENIPVNYEFERMLKNFTKAVEKTGVLREVRMRRYYVKPSEKKRLAAKSKRRE